MSIAQNFSTTSPSLSLDFANVQALDSRVTFARATTATYYGTRTALAEQNLTLYSQEFDQANWSKGAVTVTANSTAAPDGTTTADTVIPTATTATHQISSNTSIAGIGVNTLSVYAKANGYSYIQLMWGSGTDYANFFLSSSGSVSQNSGGSPTITSVGNGWYRCSITSTLSVASAIYALPIQTGTETRFASTTGDGTSGLFLWGAQLEQRSTVTAYQVTTTQPVTNYVPVLETAAAGVARFDHSPTTFESLGLLIEEQRTNLLLRSDDFVNASWTTAAVAATVSSNVLVSPAGTITADKLVESASYSSIGHYIYQAPITVVSGSSYAYTIYAKAGERSFIRVSFINSTTGDQWASAYFNLAAGTVGTVLGGTASIQPVGNGYYRCIVTGTTNGTSGGAVLYIAETDNSITYTGNGFNGIYIWGAQLEASSFSTSYIPTVASQVTRAADSASMTGTNFSSWYNAAEGTVYSEATLSTGGRYFGFSDGNTNQMEALQGSTSINLFVFTNSAVQMNTNPSANAPFVANKLSFAYKTNDCSGSVNSGAISSDTTVILPIVTTFRIMNNVTNVVGAGTIKKIAYYPIRLSNTNLQALTG